MTAVDKIIERIMLDAKAEAKEIVAKGKLRAKEIIKSATDEAKALEKELKIATDKKAEAGSQSADSAAKLSIRNAVLMKKREEIEKTLDALLEHFLTLGA